MTFSKRDLVRTLEKKLGFLEVGGKKHEKYRLEVEGQVVAIVPMSRGWSEVSAPMVSSIAQQMHITSPQLREVVGCSISRDAYIQAAVAD